MHAMSRPLATLAAAAVGGAGLWLAGHWDQDTNGGYWATLGVVALVGVLLGLSQLRAPDKNVTGSHAKISIPAAFVSGARSCDSPSSSPTRATTPIAAQ